MQFVNECIKQLVIYYELVYILHINRPRNVNDANQVMDNASETCMYATRCVVCLPIETTLGALVYGRDMIMDVLLTANLVAIYDGRQQIMTNQTK